MEDLLRHLQNRCDGIGWFRQLHLKPFWCLFRLQFAIAKEFHLGNGLAEIGIALGERLHDDFSILRPSEWGDIEMLFRLIETDVCGCHTRILTVVEALGIHLDVLVGHRTFTEFHPRTGAKDALLVDVHPGLNPIEYLRFLLVVCTVGTQRHTEQQVAVLAYDIHELLDDIGRTLVASPFIDAGVVMPSFLIQTLR